VTRLNDTAYGEIPPGMIPPVIATGQRHGGYRCVHKEPGGLPCGAHACFIFAPPGHLPHDQDRTAFCPKHRAAGEQLWKDRYHAKRRPTLDVEGPQGMGRQAAPKGKARDEGQGSLFD